MSIKTIATIGHVKNTDLKAALLPVLGLCGKTDEFPPYVGALCLDVNDNSVDFWVTNGRTIFSSNVAAENVTANMSAFIRPSRFGLMREHIKKAKTFLQIIIKHSEETNAVELVITSENGTIAIGDTLDKQPPVKQPLFDAFDRDVDKSFTPEQIVFSTDYLLPVLTAFKNAISVDLSYSPASRHMRIKTSIDTPLVKFDALVCGMNPPKAS